MALEGELAPILVQMVKSANTDGLLDDDKEARYALWLEFSVFGYDTRGLQAVSNQSQEIFTSVSPSGSYSR